MQKLVLLGPQRERPLVAAAVSTLGLQDRVCAITAGWQERADEIEELQSDISARIVRLDIYRRAEQVFEKDREFFAAYRKRQNRLRQQQEVYRLRLNWLMRQCLDIWNLSAEFPRSEQERNHAIEMVRELDRFHLRAVNSINLEFEKDWCPRDRPEVSRHRNELKALISSCNGVLVAGGHVAILINRMRLFGLAELISPLPIVAWAGGAMVLAKRLMLFHDKPPQGPGFAEILDTGLALYSSFIPFPDATVRLQIENPARLDILQRRISPQQCLLLDPGTQAIRRNDEWDVKGPIVTERGEVKEWAAAALEVRN